VGRLWRFELRRFVAVCALLFVGCAPIQPNSQLMFTQLIANASREWTGLPAKGEQYAEWLPAFEAVARTRGYQVVTMAQFRETFEAWGATFPKQHLVMLESDLSGNAKVAVLTHELGHVLQPQSLTNRESELFAQSVAYVTTQKLGIDQQDFLLGWLRPVEQEEKDFLRLYGFQIDAVANLIAKEVQDARRASQTRR
jgi:hypothetical protein